MKIIRIYYLIKNYRYRKQKLNISFNKYIYTLNNLNSFYYKFFIELNIYKKNRIYKNNLNYIHKKKNK